MRKYGGYHEAQEHEPDNPLLVTKKRSYTVLNPDAPGTTITTMPDDFVHYDANRSLTVREMARIQSFDDSFVFQLLEPLLESGKITLDLAAHFNEDGSWRDHGMLFKMKPNELPLLFGTPVEYDLETYGTVQY